MKKIGVAQWGTKHGHAKGWLDLLHKSKNLDFKGLFEPDTERKRYLISTKEKIWEEINWIHDFDTILSDKTVEIIFIEESNNKSLEVLEKCICLLYTSPSPRDRG